MKKFLSLFIVVVLFTSCQEDLKKNDPGFQGVKDDVLWRANDAKAYLSLDGKLTIEAQTEYEKVTLSTSSIDAGIYTLGTVNTDDSASYSSAFNGLDLEYGTAPIAGPVYSVLLYNSGSGGYTSDCDLQANYQYTCDSSHNTTGGSGSGLAVSIVATGGVVSKVIRVAGSGNSYLPGDIVTIAGGDLIAKVKVVNTQNSNGEIEITEFDNINMTVSGKFKFNAVNTNNSPFAQSILNFQYGEFYKLRIYPSL